MASLLFTVLCLTEPSAVPGTCLGEARLQGSQGDEDGFLEEKCSNGLGPAALSRALRRVRTGPASLLTCHWPDACPAKGFAFLFLSLPLCKMGMTGGTVGACLCPRVRGGNRKFSALGIGIRRVGAGLLVGRVQLAVLQHLAPKGPLGTGGLGQSTCLVTAFETEGPQVPWMPRVKALSQPHPSTHGEGCPACHGHTRAYSEGNESPE